MSISGGQHLDLFDPTLGQTLSSLSDNEGFTVLHLSLANGAELRGAELKIAADRAAGLVAAALLRLGAYPTLARDFFLSGGAYVPRDIALLLDGNDTDHDGSLASLAQDLVARGLPFSRIDSEGAPGDCAVARLPGDTPLAECIAASGSSLGAEAAASVIVGADEINGLGPDARMHLQTLDFSVSARLDRLTLAESDRVLHIRSKDVGNPLARARLAQQLADAQGLGQVRLHSVPALRDLVMVSDPVLQRYWSIRGRRLSDPARLIPPDGAEKSRLMEDAALAWSYFERHTFAETGLAAGTVLAVPGGRVNGEVTLWDVGSQVNAIIAARDLRLIGRIAATDMIRGIVAALPTDRLDGTMLPPANFSAQTLRTTVTGFDSCDTGRLGIALERAVSRSLVDKGEILDALNGWQLEKAVRNGAHYSHHGAKWRDTSQSHCTDYIVPGFAFLGLDVRPLQDPTLKNAEAEITALYDAASLGAIATEPFALKAIEGNPDSPTQLFLDALFDAQLGWFETTGELRAISETPIDQEPWFLYSGLKLDSQGPEAWVIGTIAGTTKSLSAASGIISSKAAYLWNAVHPHDYSDLLVQTIRERARIPGHGFSVGVYADTLQPVPNYTDINTNGIILSAIAQVLSPR